MADPSIQKKPMVILIEFKRAGLRHGKETNQREGDQLATYATYRTSYCQGPLRKEQVPWAEWRQLE